jgi:hypothetical protein
LNKILSIKSNAIFLAAILVAGTIALSVQSFMIGAHAQPYYYDGGMDTSYNSYESLQYPSYKPDYKAKYSSDNNNYKSKDSKSVSINKIKCINNNVNINGNNTGDINIGNKGAANEEGYSSGYSSNDGSGYGGEGYYDGGQNYKKDKGFNCIINNNNTNTNFGGGGNQTIPPGPTTTNLNVTKLVTCQQVDGSSLVPSIQQLSANCDDLLALITEDQFNITVTDTNVSPSNFNGSEIGTLVTLDAGPFTVTEEPDDSVAADVATLEDIQTNITGPIPSFLGDCTQTGIGSFSATGDIAAGGQETCNIVNNFVMTRNDGLTGGSSIISQGIADSSELTALEKVEKLKKQWLELLP